MGGPSLFLNIDRAAPALKTINELPGVETQHEGEPTQSSIPPFQERPAERGPTTSSRHNRKTVAKLALR